MGMQDERFDEAMDAWLQRELDSAPELRPTDRMRRLVAARRRGRWGPLRSRPVRWTVVSVGMAAAALFALSLWAPDLLPFPGGSDGPGRVPHVSVREWLASAGGVEVRGPSPERLSTRGGSKGPGRGPKKGDTPFEYLLLQVHARGSNTIVGTNLAAGSTGELEVAPGDDYRLILRPKGDVYVRIFQQYGEADTGARAAEPGLEQLFPRPAEPSGARATAAIPGGEIVYVPAREGWFQLDADRGPERVTVVASPEPLPLLDELGARYRRETDERDLATLRRQILERIAAIPSAGGPATVLEFWLNPR